LALRHRLPQHKAAHRHRQHCGRAVLHAHFSKRLALCLPRSGDDRLWASEPKRCQTNNRSDHGVTVFNITISLFLYAVLVRVVWGLQISTGPEAGNLRPIFRGPAVSLSLKCSPLPVQLFFTADSDLGVEHTASFRFLAAVALGMILQLTKRTPCEGLAPALSPVFLRVSNSRPRPQHLNDCWQHAFDVSIVTAIVP
jgi:hypothetical protein